MVSSHCLICGDIVVSGLYCHECLWEIKRIRLKNDVDLETWMRGSLQPGRKMPLQENTRTLESFSSP
ncbi:MAG: nucleotide-binding protein [Candidatus Thermoplasmatota archaeon]|nr:nucleotide-binding protein [Candidatus Thermoplasmatota archaeon]MCL5790036.1 nucleotide-binding protein [Candidatus Thermoplasmatota archaeon]